MFSEMNNGSGGSGGSIPVYVMTGVGTASNTQYKCTTLDGASSSEGERLIISSGSQTLIDNDDIKVTVTGTGQFQIYNKVPIRICRKASTSAGWFSYTEVNSSTTTTYNYESDIVVQRQS